MEGMDGTIRRERIPVRQLGKIGQVIDVGVGQGAHQIPWQGFRRLRHGGVPPRGI